MTLNELVNEVINITKRVDLQSETQSAVIAATLKAHSSDYFFRDLVELAVQFDAPRYIQTFYPKSISALYRQVKYMRIWNGDVTGDAGDFLEHMQIEAALDNYGYIRTNVFYMAGQFLQIRATAKLDKILFGFYQFPNVVPVSYSSWIAADYPWAIIYEAARTVFLITGYQEQSASMRSLVQEQYATLKISNVDTIPT